MEMEFLGDSTCIESAGYKSGYLTIQFQDGSIYTYEDVPPSAYSALKISVSKGWHFNKYIRDNYSFIHGMAPDTDWITDTAHAIRNRIEFAEETVVDEAEFL